jgi:site-specific DNA-methyltransferase (adenine-specific)/adenine-specific DNA-methyltransferase
MPENREFFEFFSEPIQGCPELRWAGKRPYTGTRYCPAQCRESYGRAKQEGIHAGWMNRLYRGDNLQVMSHLLGEFRGKIDLIYIDPPFDSKADYKKKIELKGQTALNNTNFFEEKQYGDIWADDTYLQFMYERLVLMRELLSETGSIYLHCDWHKSHYLRLIMDEVFGYSNFLNDVVWLYSGREIPIKKWNPKHDNLLIYVKKYNSQIFNTEDVLDAYTPGTEKKYKYEENGVKFQIRGKAIKGSPINKADGLSIECELKYPGLTYRQYYKGGTAPRDWWNIPMVNKAAHERTDYPTQKPEALLERIIKASSLPGGIVFDCFMGSGTTQAVAMKLGRRFIGADINQGAIQTAARRLLGIAKEVNSQLDNEDKYTGFEVYDVDTEIKKEPEPKGDTDADIIIHEGRLIIKKFCPMNLLRKLALQKTALKDNWRVLAESVMIDFNYNGAVLRPAITDIPAKDELVKGEYEIPKDAGIIRVKITDLLSQSLEMEVKNA